MMVLAKGEIEMVTVVILHCPCLVIRARNL